MPSVRRIYFSEGEGVTRGRRERERERSERESEEREVVGDLIGDYQKASC